MSNKKPLKKLSPKHKQFCKEYIIDLNASQAYIRAGYTTKNANNTASKLLAKDHIQAEIQVQLEARAKRTEINADMVIKELALLAFSDTGNLFNSHNQLIQVADLPEDVTRTIQEVTSRIEKTGTGEDATYAEIIKIKSYDKKGALDSLGKHFGIYEADNHQQKVEPVSHITKVYV